MTDRPSEFPGERETASFNEGIIRKGIEIVQSQEMPADWTPPTMGLGPATPTQDAGSGAQGNDAD